MKIQMKILLLFTYLLSAHLLKAQSLQLSDGSALPNTFCYSDSAIQITTDIIDASIKGCGIYQQNGFWYFNPALAAQSITVFPYSCNITIESSHISRSQRVIIHKPVIIEPALQDQGSCDGRFRISAKTRYAGSYQFSWYPSVYVDHPDKAQITGLVPSTTQLYLTVIDNVSGCKGSDSLIVSKYPLPKLQIAHYDSVVTARSQINLSVSGAERYQWTPAKWLNDHLSNSPIVTPQSTITYTIRGINEYNCYDSLTVPIVVLDDIFIPNAFSPNGDGLNDVFRISNIGYQGNGGFQIFNRYGNEVFSGVSLTDSWDGTYKGVALSSGVYFYLIVLNNMDGSTTQYRG